jgi:hypothetical protein
MPLNEENAKRDSPYRHPICSFCKLRHPPPNDGNCVMAVIARADEIPDEIPPPRRTKAAMAPNTLSGAGEQSVPPVTGGSGEQTSGPSDDQAEGAVGGSATDDSGYAQIALVMATFAKDMQDFVRELRQEVSDLRQEQAALPVSPAIAHPPPPATSGGSTGHCRPSHPTFDCIATGPGVITASGGSSGFFRQCFIRSVRWSL